LQALRSIPARVLLLLCLSGSLCAVDPSTHITQYAHTAWRIQDGVFSGAPNAITQTADGYLWIGTPNGLFRFDGVRFTPWVPADGKPTSNGIFSLLAGTDGSLWIGTGTNLARLKDGVLTNFMDHRGRVNAIVQDRNGTVWMTRTRVQDENGPICQVMDTRLLCKGKADGITPPYAGPLIEDLEGNLWFGSATTVTRWRVGSSATFAPPQLKPAEDLNGVQALAVTRDGSIWSGMNRKGRGLGLQQFIKGSWKPFVAPGLNGEELEVEALFVDRQNTLWVGTDNQGVYRIHEGKAERFNSADGLSGDSVTGFYEDREGNLWVVTTEGIDSFRDVPVLTLSTREGLSTNLACSVLAAHDGTVWIGNQGSLDYLREDKLNSIRLGVGRSVTSLFEDHAGQLWVGIDNALYVYKEGRFEAVAGAKDGSVGTVVAITEDRDHNIWAETIGKPRKLVRIQGRRVREELPAPEMPVAQSLAADPNGGIWLGLVNGLARYQHKHLETFPVSKTLNPRWLEVVVLPDGSVMGASRAGLIYWRNGTLKVLTAQNGLPCDDLFGIIFDADNEVWLSTQCGLVQVANTELHKWWEDSHTVVRVKTFDVFDGARPWRPPFQPHASRSADGRLWFANENVVQMIDPHHLRTNTIAPPLLVEQLVADHKSYSPSPRVSLPALTRDLEIDYTALSFRVPQKVRFRYKLEGHDRDWQEPGTRRQAFYNDLHPGRYRFRVTASNNDGVWNEAGASLDFYILPSYYQTAWFRIACAGAVLLLLWAAYGLRVQQLGRRFAIGLEARVNERTRIARDLHDTLLQSFQGLMLRLQLVEDLLPEGKAKTQLEQTLQRADQAIAEGRRAVYDLRSSTAAPTDLTQALRTLGDEFATENSAAFHLVVEGTGRDLNPIIRDELYLITREALRNAFSHARAQHIEAEITYGERTFQLRIRDDGEGIPTQILEEGRPGHYGLSGMRERAKQIGGKLELWSRAGAGTEIDLSIPGSVAYRTSVARPLFSLLSLFGRKAG